MSEKNRNKPELRSRIVPIVLFAIAAVLLIVSVAGFILQGTDNTVE